MSAGTPPNPFPGLRPFQEQDDQLFFGRDSQIDELLERLRRTRFVAVVGTSGSGKSSLVRAGLVPALHGGFMVSAGSPNWRIVIMRPGSAPIANLATQMCKPADGDTEAPLPMDPETRLRVGLMRAVLGSSALGLVEVVRQARGGDGNVLVIVDQFEELFRFERAARRSSAAADEAVAFVRLLLSAAAQTETPIYVLITMRSDFLGDCARFHDLPEALNEGLFLVPRLTRDQLREAIEGPVAVAGATITPRLVNALLEDIGDDPSQLPPLQHALMRTFDIWTRRREPAHPLDLVQYEETGKIRSALSFHGDDIYTHAQAPKPTTKAGIAAEAARRGVIERLFKALTEQGADGRRTRRPASLRDCIAATGADRGAVLDVVAAFRERRASFLMPPPDAELDDDTVLDIAHESLMENWARLRGWVDEEAESAREYKRLADAAELHARRRAALWRGPELKAALRWKKKQRPTQGWAARYNPHLGRNLRFLKAAVAERWCGWCARTVAVTLILFIIAALVEAVGRRTIRHYTDMETPVLIIMLVILLAAIFGWCAFQVRRWWLVRKLRAKPRAAPALADAPATPRG